MKELLATLGEWFHKLSVIVIVAPWESVLRVRAGKHVRVLGPGVHPRIPVLDAVYRQSVRRRMCSVATQTISTREGATVVIGASLGYSLADIAKLYDRLHHAEDTLMQLTAVHIAGYVQRTPRADLTPQTIAAAVTAEIRGSFESFGLGEVEVRVTDFAFIRAFRLIQDGRWTTHHDFLDTMKRASA